MCKYKIIINKFEKTYYKDDRIHRNFGPAAIYQDGTEYWFKNGIIHRENGPAVKQKDGKEIWIRNGKMHREDGPASIWWFNDNEWWINGVKGNPNDGSYLRLLFKYKSEQKVKASK